MTTEEDFQNALDAEPDNHHLRLVFADWLEERGDIRAAGYRALAINQKNGANSTGLNPTDFKWASDLQTYWRCAGRSGYSGEAYERLPGDWFSLLKKTDSEDPWSGWYSNRKEAEDDAASVFLKLPVERQQELLSQPVLC
jgi:uncharacterized protein (TIGR02996 family)